MTTDAENQPAPDSSMGPFTHGQLGYLQLPARDIARSAAFYAGVFGWQVEPDHAGFEGPGLIGQFVDDRYPADSAGPVIWLVVKDINRAGADVVKHGGQVIEEPTLDGGDRWLSMVEDPAGNQIGVVSSADQ